METTATMTTQEVANRLVTLCREGNWKQAQEELFANDARSIEFENPHWPEAKGLEAIKAKGEQWESNVAEYHGVTVSDPIVAGNCITLTMGMDFTDKSGQRMSFEEVCVYRVKDGKITMELFIS